jgi:hypothetical protein
MTIRSLVAAWIVVAGSGCNRLSDTDVPRELEDMLGTWKRMYRIDGWTGDTTSHPTDEEDVTIIERDGTYSRMIDGRTTESGRYTIRDQRISFDDPREFWRILIQNDTLHLSLRYGDGPEYVYVRL